MGDARRRLGAGGEVIDLAADSRFNGAALWEEWSGRTHACVELLAEPFYGLPERNRAAARDATCIDKDGCYPTAVELGFMPLIENGLIDLERLVADCKSGASGAGRSATVGPLMSQINESVKANGAPGHRHLPEIRQVLTSLAAPCVGLPFVPPLMPLPRGIDATLYATLKSTDVDLQALFEQRYRNEVFVDVLPAGSHPETRTVRGGNNCRIAVHRPQDGDTVVVLSVIDNLVKGAAGQAVQNMNIMFGDRKSVV